VAGILVRLSKTGLKRGFLEGSRGWLYVGLAASAVRIARRVLAEPVVVERFELDPGETVEIRTIKP
jgi:hypothetical protein